MTNLHNFIQSNKYTLLVHKRSNNETYEIMGKNEGNIVKRVEIREQLETPLVEARITIRYSPNINNVIEVGDIISYFDSELTFDYQIEFRRKHIFFVMEIQNNETTYDQSIICRNGAHWLIRNAFYFKINDDETTSQFIQRTALDKNIPIDNIEPTVYQHQAKVFNQSSLFEAWYEILATNILEEQLLYNIRYSDIGVVLEKIQNTQDVWVFEASEQFPNMLNPSRTISIIHPDFTNIITAINNESGGLLFGTASGAGDDINIIDKVINQDSVGLYGEFPTEVNVNSFGDEEEIRDKLQMIVDNGVPVDSMDFRTYAINSIKPSDKIIVNYPNIGSLGLYFIESMSTIIQDKRYWHDLHVVKRKDIQGDLISQLNRPQEESGGILTRTAGA